MLARHPGRAARGRPAPAAPRSSAASKPATIQPRNNGGCRDAVVAASVEGGLIVPVVAGLAHVSDLLFTTAIAVYSLALVSYCGEYAFGRSGRVARTSAARPAALVGAGTGVPPAEEATEEAGAGDGPGGGAEPSATAGRFGRAAAALTALGLLLHLGSLAARGVATDRVPWGNMYEFSSAAGAGSVSGRVRDAAGDPADVPGRHCALRPGRAAGAGAAVVLAGDPRLGGRDRDRHLHGQRRGDAALPGPGAVGAAGRGRLGAGHVGGWAGLAAAGGRGAGPAGLSDDRVRVPDLDLRRDRRGDLGGGRLGPVLGLGPEGDLGVHRLGDLRGVPARPGDRGLAWGEGRPDQPARLLRDAVQLLHRQHRHLRPALLRRPELTVVSTGPPAPLRPCSKSAATTRPGAGSREPSILSGLVGCPSFSEGWRMGGEREAMALRMPTRRARRRRAAR